MPRVFLADFDIVDPTDPLRATPGGGPHPDYLLESPMSDGTIEEDFEAALARDDGFTLNTYNANRFFWLTSYERSRGQEKRVDSGCNKSAVTVLISLL